MIFNQLKYFLFPVSGKIGNGKNGFSWLRPWRTCHGPLEWRRRPRSPIPTQMFYMKKMIYMEKRKAYHSAESQPSQAFYSHKIHKSQFSFGIELKFRLMGPYFKQ
ncbi:hypothetical protein HMPREF3038_02511 [Akkermansia sp. KLE1797]|nr:hypothetical protein HMPREF3038_02511 [Akkermansia sp. KLE1797]KXU52942.1 hypothetical protein HMPREF3039_02870 [Akkermansia sp. KLE1798]KZA03048.1 hypothetical protein HMPREF1326_03318 [Akkermansia sp. KLE1605]